MATRKPGSAVPISQKADKKRVDILKSARHCFRKNGFHQTSMQEICAEVGLGPGAVYRYFASKQEIIEAMAEDERRQARAIIVSLHGSANLPDTLDALTRAFATRDTLLGDAALMTEVYAEGMRNKRVASIIRKAEAEWVEALAVLLRTAQARGQIDPTLDARQTALFVTAIWDGVVIRRAFHPEEKDSAMIDFFECMLRRVLARDPRREKSGKSVLGALPEFSPVAPPQSDSSDDNDLRQLSLI